MALVVALRTAHYSQRRSASPVDAQLWHSTVSAELHSIQPPPAAPPAVPDLYSKDLTNSPRIIKPAGVSAYDLTPDVVADLKTNKNSPKNRSVLKGNAVTLTAGTGAELAAAV